MAGWSGNSQPQSLQQMTDETNVQNKKRETEIRGILDQIIQMYQPGGSYGAGAEAMLDRQKQRDIGSATQSLISSGLFGSTMTAGLPKKWEEEVGVPARLKLEDSRYGMLSQAMGNKASFVESIKNSFPDYKMFADMFAQSASAPSGISGTGDVLGTSFGKGVGPNSSGIYGSKPTPQRILSGWNGQKPIYETVTI